MPGIRPARTTDLEALLRLERNFPGDKLSRRSFNHFLTKGHSDVLVLECDNEILADAVVLYRKRSGLARLYSLVVDPQARGKGYAKILLEACETAARNHDGKQMQLEVREDNLAAIRLYERSGYQTLKKLDAYYEDGAAALKMLKVL